MHLLLVNAHGVDTSAGGAERYTRDLVDGLRERGHAVTVVAAFPPRDGNDSADVVLHRSDWRDSLSRRALNRIDDVRARPAEAITAAIRRTAPDIVHTNSLAGVTTGVWSASAACDLPVVHTLHDYYLDCVRTTLTRRDGSPCPAAPLYCGFRARRLLRHAQHVSHVVGVSQTVLDRHAHAFAGTASSVIRHPLVPGTPVPPPSAPPRAVGYLGRLEREKGVDLLLAAAEQGLRVRIAGSGREQERVESAARAGLVEYAGVVRGEAKAAFLASCDVGLVPSTWLEPGGPPYTVLEWLGAGRPVVVAPTGGLQEAADRYEGVASFDGTPGGLAAALAQITPPPPVPDGSDRERWLDEHEAVYAAARR